MLLTSSALFNSRYKTLWNIIMKPFDAVRPAISVNYLNYPKQVFGEHQKDLKTIKTVVVDIVHTVAAILLEPEVVGENLRNFRFSHTKEYNSEGQQIYGNVTSANWFRSTEKAVKEKWGEDVCLLALNISTDKTQVDRLRSLSIWPCYVTILNLDGTIRRTHLGSECIGYCPLLPYSAEGMSTLLQEQYGVRTATDSNDARKMIERYLEQEFLSTVLEPLIRMEQSGPVLMQIGTGANAKVAKFMFKLNCFISDNEGSHQSMCCKTKNTFYPCRVCEIPRTELMRSNIAAVSIRDSNMYKPYLEEAFDAFCCRIKLKKNEKLSDRQEEVLKFCNDKSVLPILPALLLLEPSYHGHSAYERVPPDHLHTVTGILEYWVALVLKIVSKISKTHKGYHNAIAILEECILRFPYRQAMPFRVKHFIHGLSSICPTIKSNAKAKSKAERGSYGTVGMIDNKDVPSLVLQILLCKYELSTFLKCV